MQALGPLPPEAIKDVDLVKKFDMLYRAISKPVTDEEARVLIQLFGQDGCFGLASSLMHLIETAPGWPLIECLENQNNEWIVEMRNRCIRGGLIPLAPGEQWPREFGQSSKVT
ncbi:hypothetical protein [Rhodoferax fermentans]|uniref:Uncharacterized protein n=1 Tax=Rhodoferax fermentans TaxID=28066 RepID=A0A1T1AVY8_RHOFE|nr:hypothetical protein [Rhodoferax fermentans]MBK1685402.1 hypothetical protein [Rhodoferax fermentans]OOV08193.1 hypothetical protein RF819_17020 [Rhodoferax fermentans]